MSDSQVIPEAAVEAAARASFQFMEDRPWKAVDPDEVDFFREAARAALEAAAPHMLAEVWEEGFDYARNDSWTPESNPYRPTT